MTICPWEEILGFRNFSEVDDFKNWMREQIELGKAQEIQVNQWYLGDPPPVERWFKHLASGEIWRLVEPDPPFYGIFVPVPKKYAPWNSRQFKNRTEYVEFEKWLFEKIETDELEELNPECVNLTRVDNTTYEGRWFKHRDSGELWRLLNPNPPFNGSFEKIN
jgi:hypothetical protein